MEIKTQNSPQTPNLILTGKIAAALYQTRFINGTGSIKNHPIYPGIEISFHEFSAATISFPHEEIDTIMEINYCHDGRAGWNMNNDHTIYLGPGDYSIHTLAACAGSSLVFPSGNYKGLTIHIDLNLLTEQPPELLKGTSITGQFLYRKFCCAGSFSTFPGEPKIKSIFAAFYDFPRYLRKPYFKLKLQELLIYLSEQTEAPHKAQYQSEQLDIVRRIHEHLTENINQRFTIEELAKRYLINSTTLKTVFKTVYGTSIAAHIKEHRIEKAAGLLIETNDSISQIAKRVGYENQSKFTAAFKDVYQVLPTEYRKHHKPKG